MVSQFRLWSRGVIGQSCAVIAVWNHDAPSKYLASWRESKGKRERKREEEVPWYYTKPSRFFLFDKIFGQGWLVRAYWIWFECLKWIRVFMLVESLHASSCCAPGPNPRLRMAAELGLTVCSHLPQRSTKQASADTHIIHVLHGHIFIPWHSSPHTCQHFLSLSSLFSWMLVIIVLITSHHGAETFAACSLLTQVPLLVSGVKSWPTAMGWDLIISDCQQYFENTTTTKRNKKKILFKMCTWQVRQIPLKIYIFFQITRMQALKKEKRKEQK